MPDKITREQFANSMRIAFDQHLERAGDPPAMILIAYQREDGRICCMTSDLINGACGNVAGRLATLDMYTTALQMILKSCTVISGNDAQAGREVFQFCIDAARSNQEAEEAGSLSFNSTQTVITAPRSSPRSDLRPDPSAD